MRTGVSVTIAEKPAPMSRRSWKRPDVTAASTPPQKIEASRTAWKATGTGPRGVVPDPVPDGRRTARRTGAGAAAWTGRSVRTAPPPPSSPVDDIGAPGPDRADEDPNSAAVASASASANAASSAHPASSRSRSRGASG